MLEYCEVVQHSHLQSLHIHWWAHFVVDCFHFQFPLIHRFSVDVFHVTWSMHLWCFLECLLFSLSRSVDHKLFALITRFLDAELSIKCESLFCRVDLVFVQWYWNNSGWYLYFTFFMFCPFYLLSSIIAVVVDIGLRTIFLQCNNWLTVYTILLLLYMFSFIS